MPSFPCPLSLRSQQMHGRPPPDGLQDAGRVVEKPGITCDHELRVDEVADMPIILLLAFRMGMHQPPISRRS